MKMLRLSQFAAASLMMLLISVPAFAAPLDHKQLPENAKWVLHVDLDAIAQTDLVERVRQNRPGIVNQVRQWIQNRYGIDPREDLHSLTAYSDSYQAHTGTMLLKAKYDQNKVAAELKNQPNVQTTTWEDYTLYTVQKKDMLRQRTAPQSPDQAAPDQARPNQAARDQAARGTVTREQAQDGKSMTIVLVDGETAVFASSPERAQMAIKLLKGDAPSLKADSKLIADMPQKALAYGAAIDLGSIERREGFFPVLSQHEQIVWLFGLDNGEAHSRLKLVANSEEVAKEMKTALEGAVAFGKVWAADSPSLKKLADDTKITIDGKTVERNWRGDSQVLLDAFGELSTRFQQRLEAARP